MPKSKSTSSPAPQAPEKTFKTAEGNLATPISSGRAVAEIKERLEVAVKHVRSVHVLLMGMPEEDEWATGLGFCLQGLQMELEDIKSYIGRLAIGERGDVVGIIDEKGGARGPARNHRKSAL